MQGESPGPLIPKQGQTRDDLFPGKAVLRLLRLPDDGIPPLEGAGVVAAGDQLRYTGTPAEVFDVGVIIQIDDGPQVPRRPVLRCGGLVGGIVIATLGEKLISYIAGNAKDKREKEIEKIKYQKEILELEIEKGKTQVKLLEEENKKLDKIIYEK
ncbi:hypothetical protein AGMMS49991_12080 [Spirochaetia bacterium]|nr:hypothetical protein AGMMS49991_12080 [Spirochaetia bacterium]